MKLCDFCRSEFALDQKGSGGANRKFCYTCLPNGLTRKERNKRRTYLYAQMARRHKEELGCSSCGYNKYGGALEWHHPDGDKEFDPSYGLNKSWEVYLTEINKCILLCANCHREEHWQLRNVA